MKTLPPWTILHIPHDSTFIPEDVRREIVLTKEELDKELLAMTDFWTHALFANGFPQSRTVIAPANRLVVDVERFTDDSKEIMASRGMGVIYTRTSQLKKLKSSPKYVQRNRLINRWYVPHHRRLTELVDESLTKFGKALILDCHSFASSPLPYEINTRLERPEICIGTDEFHSPKDLADSVRISFECSGFDVDFNCPFSGALTPLKHYRKDKRIQALMIEIRRDLYEDETTGAINLDFGRFSNTLLLSLSRTF